MGGVLNGWRETGVFIYMSNPPKSLSKPRSTLGNPCLNSGDVQLCELELAGTDVGKGPTTVCGAV